MITDNILSTKHKQPKIHQNAYINPYAMVIGDVTIHSGVSLWPGVIIRGDENWVEIKANTIVLDRSIITAQPDNPVYIGCNVLVSHDVNLFGCVIHDNVLIGLGVTIFDSVEIGPETVIAAGATIPKNSKIPSRSKVLGPAAGINGCVTDLELLEIKKKHSCLMEKATEYGEWYVTSRI